MSKCCIGCGVELQNEEKDNIGYTPKLDAEYCQRCFRIQHYDDVTISMKEGIDPSLVLQKIASYDALILWVVDVYDFEANLVPGLNRHLMNKDIVMVVTKRDLLPDTLGDQKLGQFIFSRLKEAQIQVQGLVVCGDLAKHASADGNGSIQEVKKAIAHYRGDRDVIVMGMANAGKSTMLNALLAKKSLTTSRYPGTTLDFVAIPQDGYTLYDTPGLTRFDSLLTKADEALMKTILPSKRLKARGYQLRKDQSLAIGGLVRLDLIGCDQVSCVCYFGERLQIHRGKQEKADALWAEHMGSLLQPVIEENFEEMQRFTHPNSKAKLDVVIHGLGWFCIQGVIEQIQVYVPQGVAVTFRKAMI